jgi:hypothetical protein
VGGVERGTQLGYLLVALFEQGLQTPDLYKSAISTPPGKMNLLTELGSTVGLEGSTRRALRASRRHFLVGCGRLVHGFG